MNLKETFTAVQAASRKLALLDDQTINRILNAVADAAIAEKELQPILATWLPSPRHWDGY